jgi:hypothetical protein
LLKQFAFPGDNRLHHLTGIGLCVGQRPGKPFAGGQLARSSLFLVMAPKADEASYRTTPTAQVANLFRGPIGRAGSPQIFGLLDQSFHKDAGLGIPQAARQGIVRQDGM